MEELVRGYMGTNFEKLVAFIQGKVDENAQTCKRLCEVMPPGPARTARLKKYQDRCAQYQALLGTAAIIASED
jgi:hypothetical protein